LKDLKAALAFLAVLLLVAGCARTGTFKRVEFTVPPRPDPALRPYLEDVARIGVMCVTNIEPIKELDTEKVLARLSEAVARKLGTLPDVAVVSQDEITWQLREIEFDSTRVVSEGARQALIDTLSLDAFILVELENLQARVTPMTPTPYGLVADTGLDLAVNLKVSLVNLHSGRVWQQSGQRRDWQQVRLQLFGGNQGERQLLMALSRPLEQFLMRVAPPPRIQVRHFELSGE
jgi:hypothetical protein